MAVRPIPGSREGEGSQLGDGVTEKPLFRVRGLQSNGPREDVTVRRVQCPREDGTVRGLSVHDCTESSSKYSKRPYSQSNGQYALPLLSLLSYLAVLKVECRAHGGCARNV